MIGHWYGRLGAGRRRRLRLVSRRFPLLGATVVGIGSIILPALMEQGYPPRFSAGVIATSGALGILFPPSIKPRHLCGGDQRHAAARPTGAVVDSASIGQLFIAALVPGLILAFMLGATTWYRAWRYDYPRMARSNWRECWHAFRESVWGLMLIVLVSAASIPACFTADRSRRRAAVYSFVLAVFVLQRPEFSEVPAVLLKAAHERDGSFYSSTNAAVFLLLPRSRSRQSMAEWMTAQVSASSPSSWSPTFAARVRQLMDPAAITLIMAPIPVPMAARLGVHPVHLWHPDGGQYGGRLCHPAVGLDLYVA